MLVLKDRFALYKEIFTGRGTLYSPVVSKDATAEVSTGTFRWGPQSSGYTHAATTESTWLKATPVRGLKDQYLIEQITHTGANSWMNAAINDKTWKLLSNPDKPQTFDVAQFQNLERDELNVKKRKFMQDRVTFSRGEVDTKIKKFVRDAAQDGYTVAVSQPFTARQAFRPEPLISGKIYGL